MCPLWDMCVHKLFHWRRPLCLPGFIRQISLMTYQPKSVGKMADFETLTLCISLNSSQMCSYVCKHLVTGYCLYLLKFWFPAVIRFQIDFVTHTLLLWAWHYVKLVYTCIWHVFMDFRKPMDPLFVFFVLLPVVIFWNNKPLVLFCSRLPPSSRRQMPEMPSLSTYQRRKRIERRWREWKVIWNLKHYGLKFKLFFNRFCSLE